VDYFEEHKDDAGRKKTECQREGRAGEGEVKKHCYKVIENEKSRHNEREKLLDSRLEELGGEREESQPERIKHSREGVRKEAKTRSRGEDEYSHFTRVKWKQKRTSKRGQVERKGEKEGQLERRHASLKE